MLNCSGAAPASSWLCDIETLSSYIAYSRRYSTDIYNTVEAAQSGRIGSRHYVPYVVLLFNGCNSYY